MAKFYLDTEFVEGFHKPLFGKKRHFIELISIGIVSEDGRDYYAINKEMDVKKAWNAHDVKRVRIGDNCFGNIKEYWVRDNVLKPLHLEMCKNESTYAKTHFHSLFSDFTKKSLQRLIKWQGKTKKQIAYEIFRFIHADIIKKYDDKLEHAEYIVESAYSQHKEKDHEFFAYFGSYDWVVLCTIFGRMIDLPTGFPMYVMDLKQIMDEKGLTKEWKRENCPDPEGEHNALVDAKWNKMLHEKMLEL